MDSFKKGKHNRQIPSFHERNEKRVRIIEDFVPSEKHDIHSALRIHQSDARPAPVANGETAASDMCVRYPTKIRPIRRVWGVPQNP
jgi:hypothetical protein